MDLFFGEHIKVMNGYYSWFIASESLRNTEENIATMSHGGGVNGFNTLVTRAPSDKSLIVL